MMRTCDASEELAIEISDAGDGGTADSAISQSRVDGLAFKR
jgi:hypothetical protein